MTGRVVHPWEVRGLALVREISEMRQNFVLAYQKLFREHGDTIRLAWPVNSYLLFHPEDVGRVLKDNHKNYVKSETYKELYPLVGQGLVTAEGDVWRRNRRIVAPEFTRSKMARYHDRIVGQTTDMLTRWGADAQAGRPRNISPDLMQLVFMIASDILFGSDASEFAPRVARCVNTFMDRFAMRVYSVVTLPQWVPTPGALASRRSIAELDEILFRLIERRRQGNGAEQNVLSRLMKAQYEDTLGKMSNQQLRDELMTLLMAGHETTGNALSWVFYLLGRYPSFQAALREELRSASVAQPPTLEQLNEITLNRRIILEAMRLFPPVPGISRQAIEEDAVRGGPIQPRAKVECSMYVTHRHPAFWQQADDFAPERFMPSQASRIEPFSYFPFGAGPRTCMGQQLAMLEMELIVAMVVQEYEIRLPSGFETAPHPTVTLRPSAGVQVHLRKR